MNTRATIIDASDYGDFDHSCGYRGKHLIPRAARAREIGDFIEALFAQAHNKEVS